MMPQKHKDETLRSIVDLTDAIARQQRIVLLFEDAHWADATTLEVLDLLIDRVKTMPVLLMLIGLENGVFDLKRLELRQNSRDDYITLRANVSFDPNAECPRFDAFLVETFGDNPPLIAYVTGLFGSFLSGHLRRQEFYVLVGPGATGKSTLVRVLQSLMGDYARSVLSSSLFEGGLGEKGDYDLAMLPGVRLAVAQEAESRFRLHGPRLKQLTGGDIIAARPIYGEPITFVPKAKILIVSNREPEADVHDGALRRRVRSSGAIAWCRRSRRDPQLLDSCSGNRRASSTGSSVPVPTSPPAGSPCPTA